MPIFNNNKIISRDFSKRKKCLKHEIKIVILKSIIRSRNISIKQRLVCRVHLSKLTKKKTYITNQMNVCLLSAKKKTTFKITNMSRYVFKQLGDFGILNNFRR